MKSDVKNRYFFFTIFSFLKVDDSLTKTFTNGRVHGHGFFGTKSSSSIKQLAIEVSELHAGDDGQLTLTCMSTIPGYVGYNEEYADKRQTTVKSK